MAISIGGFVNRILDKFLPDIVGDVVGGAIDSFMGNAAGAAMNFADALMDVVSFMGGEEFAAKGMEVLEGLDVGQHLENAITGGGGGGGAPSPATGGDASPLPMMNNLDAAGGALPGDGGYLSTPDGGYLEAPNEGAYL